MTYQEFDSPGLNSW